MDSMRLKAIPPANEAARLIRSPFLRRKERRYTKYAAAAITSMIRYPASIRLPSARYKSDHVLAAIKNR